MRARVCESARTGPCLCNMYEWNQTGVGRLSGVSESCIGYLMAAHVLGLQDNAGPETLTLPAPPHPLSHSSATPLAVTIAYTGFRSPPVPNQQRQP